MFNKLCNVLAIVSFVAMLVLANAYNGLASEVPGAPNPFGALGTLTGWLGSNLLILLLLGTIGYILWDKRQVLKTKFSK